MMESRLRNYRNALKESLKKSDPDDSRFIKGFDNAIGNVVHALDRILSGEGTAADLHTYPDHPGVLNTKADFDKAPGGTIVTDGDSFLEWVGVKSDPPLWYVSGLTDVENGRGMAANGPHYVIRWGRGNE